MLGIFLTYEDSSQVVCLVFGRIGRRNSCKKGMDHVIYTALSVKCSESHPGRSVAIGGPFLPGASKLASFSVASSSLHPHILGAAAPFALFPSLLVVGISLVVPIAVATCIFRQRDMVGV
jgi:hypothetical protein